MPEEYKALKMLKANKRFKVLKAHGIFNAIPLLRVALLPATIFLLFRERPTAAALGLLLLLAGLVASVLSQLLKKIRSPGRVLQLHSFLDPLADKILLWGVLATFVFLGAYWEIALVVFILRDLAVAVARWYASRDDITIPEEIYLPLMIYGQYGIAGSLFFKEWFLLRGLFISAAWAQAGVLLFTALALLLACISILHHLSKYYAQLRLRREAPLTSVSRTAIIANINSSAYHNRYRRRLLRRFASRRKAKIFFLPLSSGKIKLPSEVQRAEHLIVAGGDGSFEWALDQPAFRRKSLGFFPLGAGNAYYSYFYRGKRFEYLRSRFQFRELKLDVMEVEWDGHKRHTAFLDLGFNAEVIRLRNSGRMGYVAASLFMGFRAKPDYNLQCQTGKRAGKWSGEKHYSLPHCLNLTFGKIPWHGYALRSLLGTIQPNDGYVYGLATVNTHAPWFYTSTRLGGFLLTQINLLRPPLLQLRSREFSISSREPFPVQAGGEFLGYTTGIKVRIKRTQKVLVI